MSELKQPQREQEIRRPTNLNELMVAQGTTFVYVTDLEEALSAARSEIAQLQAQGTFDEGKEAAAALLASYAYEGTADMIRALKRAPGITRDVEEK